jgi:hypothetical protein
MPGRVDPAVPVDAKSASTGTWKTAQTAVFHSAHPHHLCQDTREKTRLTHKKTDTPIGDDARRTRCGTGRTQVACSSSGGLV